MAKPCRPSWRHHQRKADYLDKSRFSMNNDCDQPLGNYSRACTTSIASSTTWKNVSTDIVYVMMRTHLGVTLDRVSILHLRDGHFDAVRFNLIFHIAVYAFRVSG